MADDSGVFWGELAPCEHVLQLYETDEGLLDSLEKFAADGLRAGEAVIVVGTPGHLAGLEGRLRRGEGEGGYRLDEAARENAYIALEADQVLSRFLVEDWPDERLFNAELQALLSRARAGRGRRVRAFGEMVALLWARGHSGATVRLEHLWNGVCAREGLSLFCAYPRIGFTRDATRSVRETCEALQKICDAHSRVVPA
jgi:hypothetical protein